MGKPGFPPGFRFSPTDVELVRYYLKRKVMGKSVHVQVVADVDIYKYEPWDLPDKSCWPYGDRKWYFFCPREKKYASGARINRATGAGFWKMSGKDRTVSYNGEVVGFIRTLVFHTGRPPRGERTDWVLHEYRLEDKGLAEMGVPQESYVLCVLFQKEGAGPRNGAQYGAPFKEEDWSDDEVNISVDTVTHDDRIREPDPVLPRGYNSPGPGSTDPPEGTCKGPLSGSCISDVVQNYCYVSHSVSCSSDTKGKHCVSANGDIVSMLDCFTEEGILPINDNDRNKELDNLVHSGTTSSKEKLDSLNSRNADASHATEEHDDIPPSGNAIATDDIYRDLPGLGKLGTVEDGFTFNNTHDCPCTKDDIFELGDLDRPLNSNTF